MGAVFVTEQAIVNEAHRRGMRVPIDQNEIPKQVLRLVLMLSVQKVYINGLVLMDLNSLYPSVIRALNMDPATIVGQLRSHLQKNIPTKL